MLTLFLVLAHFTLSALFAWAVTQKFKRWLNGR